MRKSFRIISSFPLESPEVKKWRSGALGQVVPSEPSLQQPGCQDFMTVLLQEKSHFIQKLEKKNALIWCFLRPFDLTGWKYLGLWSSKGVPLKEKSSETVWEGMGR